MKNLLIAAVLILAACDAKPRVITHFDQLSTQGGVPFEISWTVALDEIAASAFVQAEFSTAHQDGLKVYSFDVDFQDKGGNAVASCVLLEKDVPSASKKVKPGEPMTLSQNCSIPQHQVSSVVEFVGSGSFN